jgi:hypothetical protein
MSTLEEFRHHVEALLGNIADAQQRRGAFEEDDNSIPHIARIIHIAVAVEGLLDKTPVDPPVLLQIASQIRALPLVSRILREYDNIRDFDERPESGDLEALKFKLGEILDHVDTPEPSGPNPHREVQECTSALIARGPRKRRRRQLKPRKNLKPSERRAQTVATIKKELDTLRPQMTGSESDYEALRKKHNRFLTFRAIRKRPDLKEAVMDIQARQQYIWLAEKLTAAFHGLKHSTIHTDWAHHKPDEYRRRNK